MFIKKTQITSLVILSLLISSIFSQTLSSSYIPTLIRDSVSTDSYDEVNPIYSSTTKTLFFTRLNHPDNKFGEKKSQDVWSSTLQKDSSWSEPTRLSENVNNSRYNNVLSVLDKGQTLLISGRYTKKGVWYKRGLSTVSKAEDGEWSLPESVKIPGFQNVNDGRVMHAFMNQEKTVIIFSFDKQHLGRKNNLFVSLKNGKGLWSRPTTLSGVDKVSAAEACPWLSANGDTLFYSSGREKQTNIYQSDKSKKPEKYKKWNKPSKLHLEGINSDKNESFSSLNGMNDIAFFASDREGTWDIYKVRRFERNPYILITGHIFNQFKNAPIEEKYGAQLILKELVENGDAIDTIVFVPDSMYYDTINATYSFQVPFGKDVLMVAEADSFIDHPMIFSTKGKYEYGTEVQNLNLEPLLYADVKGIIWDSLTNAVLPLDLRKLNPQITVGDLVYEDAVVDSSSNYTGVRLALGEKYAISAKVDGYDVIVDTLDLSGFESFIDTTMTLFIKRKIDPFVYISGVFVSSKDSSEVSGDTKIYLQGVEQENSAVVGSNFSLKVPLNERTFFDVNMHGYLAFKDTLYFDGVDRLDTNLVVVLSPIEKGVSMVIDHIYFEKAKAVLKESSYPSLDLLVDFMRGYPEIVIEISGHTDDVGSESYNLKLSEKRAKTVGNYLVKDGIAKERVVTKGVGFASPLVPNDTEANRAKNRRVEFLILKK
jgi:outer membrane protein OmpA-like peptidoglycan-associated protein